MRESWRGAAIAGDTQALERLLSEGLDIGNRDKYGQAALMWLPFTVARTPCAFC